MVKENVRRTSLTEQIQTILIEKITSGSLSAGERLKELQLAREFGTSQSPVREAIRSLQALGYIEHKAHVGAVVKTFSLKEIEDAFQIREALEGHCLSANENKIGRLTDRLKEELNNMQSALSQSDVQAFTEADNTFHRAIIDSSSNIQMLAIWDSLGIQLQIIQTLGETSMPLQKIYDLHPPLIDSLESYNQKEMNRDLRKHYSTLKDYWVRSNHAE